MPSRGNCSFVLPLLAGLGILGGCSADADLWGQKFVSMRPRDEATEGARSVAGGDVLHTSSIQPSGEIGNGRFANSTVDAIPMALPRGGEGYTLDLVGAPIADAAKKVLGDIIKANYLVDGRVNGTITLQTSTPVSREALLEIFETSLAVANAAIVRRQGRLDIVPLSEAMSAGPRPVATTSDLAQPGVKVAVIQLHGIAAEEMKTILEPIVRKGAILKADAARNYLVVAGTTSEISAMNDTVSVFDQDWMKGMSVAIHPLQVASPKDVAAELANVFGGDAGPNGKLIRIVPNARLNAVLVMTSRPDYLRRVAEWVKRLDRISDEAGEHTFVYYAQNRSAQELAQVLQSVLGQSSGAARADAGVAPDLAQGVFSLKSQVKAEVASGQKAEVDTVSASPQGQG